MSKRSKCPEFKRLPFLDVMMFSIGTKIKTRYSKLISTTNLKLVLVKLVLMVIMVVMIVMFEVVEMVVMVWSGLVWSGVVSSRLVSSHLVGLSEWVGPDQLGGRTEAMYDM